MTKKDESSLRPHDLKNIPFYKLSGSGNDFVFIDGRRTGEASSEAASSVIKEFGKLLAAERLSETAIEVVQRLCARGSGVGADGFVFLYNPEEITTPETVGIRYYNSDGSKASLCGNATLCTISLSDHIGVFNPKNSLTIHTAAGLIKGRISLSGQPEFQLPAAQDLLVDLPNTEVRGATGEIRIGYVTAAIPHIVVLCNDVNAIDVENRGKELRHHPDLKEGANVNFVSKNSDNSSWKIRTFERGVEGETLACGTGNAATAILLNIWDQERKEKIDLITRSGKTLTVRLQKTAGAIVPSLSGEGRLVYHGFVVDI